MSPNLRTARKQLKYPLYGADFDPSNPDFLLVGGGGGPTSSGVPNKITLLDVSRLETINEIADIDLAKDEDSVTSLAVARSDDASLLAYAGINSSVKDQEAGKNEHFRSFRIGLPAKKRKADGTEKSTVTSTPETVKTQAISRAALFQSATGAKNDAYQRVLQVSKRGGDSLAALASGLATKNEVLVIKATPSPAVSDVISRNSIEKGEASDLDIVSVEDETRSHVLSYCTDYDVYLQHIPSSSTKDIKEPIKIYSAPTLARRPKIRSLRWLNSRYMILLRNVPGGGGADLAILKTDKDYTQAQQVLVKFLTKTTKQAVGLATAALSASPKGDQQFLVAVAGQDSSIEIMSIDWITGTGVSKFRPYAHLRNVHSGPITRITFSNFEGPPLPVTKETRPQYIRLASVGVDLNVVVQTLPLRPYPAVYTKEPRYVLNPPPETLQNAINISVALLIVGLVAFCMQVFCEIRGVVPPTLHAQSWLSPAWHDRIAMPYPYDPPPTIVPPAVSSAVSAVLESASDVVDASTGLLQDLLTEQAANPDCQIVMRDRSICNAEECADDHPAAGSGRDTVQAVLHNCDSPAVAHDETIKKWDQLTEKEKHGWKKRLLEAGHWTEKQGESVLKGILFSELGAAVGAAVRGA